MSPVKAGSAARIAAGVRARVAGGDHRALGVVGGGRGAPAQGEAVGLGARRPRRARSWSPRRSAIASSPVAAGSSVPAWPAFRASSAHFALATTAAEVGPRGLVERAASRAPAGRVARRRPWVARQSSRSRRTAGERSSSRVRSIWSKRVSALEAELGREASGRSARSPAAGSRRGCGRAPCTTPSVFTPPSGSTKAVAWRRSGETRTSATVIEACASSGSCTSPRARMSESARRITSPTRSWRWLGRRRRRGVLSLPCGSHPIAAGAKSRAEAGDGRSGSGSRWSAPRAAWAGCWCARSRRRPGARLTGATERPGPPLDRPRPRRGDGRRADRRHRRGRPARGLRAQPGGARLHRARRRRSRTPTLAAQARLTHVIGTTGLERDAPGAAGGGGAARGDRARGQHERRREPPDRAGAAGGGGARARLRHRDRRDAPPRRRSTRPRAPR